ncbi:MAG: hypothetical protein AAF224_02170 [Pseudomonadota bacterium]
MVTARRTAKQAAVLRATGPTAHAPGVWFFFTKAQRKVWAAALAHRMYETDLKREIRTP